MSNDKQYDVPIEGHSYDGISELDNQLPRWWVQLFNIAIIFSIFYFGYYVLGPGPGVSKEFEIEQAALKETRAKVMEAQGGGQNGGANGVDANAILAAMKNEGEMNKGKTVFSTKCASCHGPQGQGTIGPNLTDNFWIHGGTVAEIAKTVSTGVLDKGMPPWGPVLKNDELVAVVAYVKSLKGTNPPNPKAPQGTEVKE